MQLCVFFTTFALCKQTTMDILERIDGLEAKFHEVSLLITDPSVIADQARYVRLNRQKVVCCHKNSYLILLTQR